ncbi:MAG: hypothetical protein WC828_05000 [Thermoleophilia bacterium]|jgi:hypothetical protein
MNNSSKNMVTKQADDPLDHSFYIDIILANLADKVARYGLYVERIKKQALEERINPPILGTYDLHYKTLCERVGHLYEQRFLNEELLEDNSVVFDLLGSSAEIWYKFMRYNKGLTYAPTPWARPELFAIAEEFQKRNVNNPDLQNLTIVLTNEYRYSWLIDPPVDTDVGIVDDIRIVKLPKIEKDDPLLWVLLSHEIGHDIDHHLKISAVAERKQAIVEMKSKMDKPHILNDWIGEIFSDLYGLSVLGPSYYAAFLSHILALIPMDSPLRLRWNKYRSCQPPMAIRTRCMELALESADASGWKIDKLKYFVKTHEIIGRESRNYEDEVEFRKVMGFLTNTNKYKEESIDGICRSLFNAIRSSAEECEISLSFEGNEDNIMHNVNRLLISQPACTLAQDDESENLSEKPCDVATIVDAAWFCKAGYHPKEYTDFFRKCDDLSKDWDKPFEKIAEHLHNFDRLVLASLGIASVHTFYAEGMKKLEAEKGLKRN